MTEEPPDPPTTHADAAGARRKDWYRAQIRNYRAVRDDYRTMARCLTGVLEGAAGSLGLHCIVQARAKSIASFAEKILRPCKGYSDPLAQMTDLCGARVITHTLGGVAVLSRFVEDHFDVSAADSGDKLESLAATEFGYLSRHYVVAFRPGVFPAALVPPEVVARGRKAEIQVRTLLQHAWADIDHDLGYKGRFTLPRRWRREFARLAAILEEADRAFERISVGLREYSSSYGAYFTPEQLREEIDKRTIVLEADAGPVQDLAVVHQLAKMAMSLDDWPRAVEVLRPFAWRGPAALVRDLGISLCKLHRKAPHGRPFALGQFCLRRAGARDPGDVDALASLAGTWRTRERAARDDAERRECRARAKEHYRRAYEIDPGHPYPLGNYIEYEIADHPDVDIVTFFRPALETASRRCRAQVEVGVNLPWAYFDLGKFQLLLGAPYEALRDYAKGVAESPSAFFLDAALASFTTLSGAKETPVGLEWSRDFLRLARALRSGITDPEVPAPTPDAARLDGPVVLVAGSCDAPAADDLGALLVEGFRGFRGTIVSGGTEAGVCAAVGAVQAASPGGLRTVGYVPGVLPPGVRIDPRYVEHRRTSGTTFSPIEPLQAWADLLASGIAVDQIRLIALGGGRIAAGECQMALAFGAAVGVIGPGGAEVERSLAESPWDGLPNLRRLPPDPSALRAFLGLS